MKKLSKKRADGLRTGGCLRGYSYQFYSDLEIAFGKPTYDYGDENYKVNYEWVVQYKNHLFWIYDWKVESLESFTDIYRWNIGSEDKASNELVADFKDALDKRVRLKTLEWDIRLMKEALLGADPIDRTSTKLRLQAKETARRTILKTMI
tara:strand:- start:40 stop:489 length:450 start_codon:yes stop_codon:yes gene_type:complete